MCIEPQESTEELPANDDEDFDKDFFDDEKIRKPKGKKIKKMRSSHDR